MAAFWLFRRCSGYTRFSRSCSRMAAIRGRNSSMRWPEFHLGFRKIVKRSDRAAGFVILPKRWVVERTFAWLGRCRRLAKDFENLTRIALSFVKLPLSASCLEGYVIKCELIGRTLK
jgi:transposase